MQILISIMLIIGIFPVINLLCRLYQISDLVSIMVFISYGVQSIADTFITFLILKNFRGKHRNITQLGLTLLVGAIFGIISSILIQSISSIVWIFSSMILAIIVKKLFYVDTEKISNIYVFIIVSILFLIVTFLGWQSEVGTPRTLNVIFFVIFCFIFAILKNRSRLDTLISRRSKNLDSLPKNIYIYNRKLTLILCIIPIPLLVFANKIGSSLYNLMVSILKGILSFVIWLSSLFKKESVPIEDVSPQPLMTPYNENPADVINDIATIVSVGLIIFLIYYYHEEIIGKVKEIVEDIKSIFKKTFGETQKKILEVPSNEGYTDYITDISTSRYSKRAFKKDYKRYLKMDNSIETFKFGYSTLLYGLNILDYDIKSFESVTEISNRLELVNSKEFSNLYLSIRYNDRLPTSQDRILLNDVLKEVIKKV